MSILSTWLFWSKIPIIGKFIFRILVAFSSPYTGSIGLVIESLSAGKCKTRIRHWWSLGNPFKSIHAAALLNMGEATGGLAVLSWCEESPIKYRAIVTRLEIDFFKKARGNITCVCNIDQALMPTGQQSTKVVVKSNLFNSSNELVASVSSVWTLSLPEDKKKE